MSSYELFTNDSFFWVDSVHIASLNDDNVQSLFTKDLNICPSFSWHVHEK